MAGARIEPLRRTDVFDRVLAERGLFRDWFCAQQEAVPAYVRFKNVLAHAVPDVATYTDVKDPVVDLLIAIAASWAEESGWLPHAGAGSRV
ncbi:GrpB family protein [Nonomuraea jiangxiensis]|uniref:GrpB family protein n=1 Tax=Nonomuraea jiangxiensis TaxID=633440 RepID=UPI00115FF3C3